MNQVEDNKKYCGSKLINDISQSRRPVFLQRNLRRALDHHEQNLKILNHRSTSLTSGVAASNMGLFEGLSRILPSLNLLSRVTSVKPQTFRVHPKSLVKKEKNSADAETRPNVTAKHEPSADPTWLPAPNNIKITCNITCIITLDDANGTNPARVLYSKSHPANLTGVKDAKGHLTFYIAMEPFVVAHNEMLTSHLAAHNGNGGRRWKAERLNHAVLSMSVSCFNSEDAFQLLSAVDPDVIPGHIVAPEQAELRATWKKLPDCPSTPLHIRRYEHVPETTNKARRSKKLEYLLDADISWSPSARKSGTPLAMCNNITRILENRGRPQITRPLSLTQACNVRYVFDGGAMGSRSIVRTRFSCVFCPDRLPHATFDRLHFHYLSFHDHFTFKVHAPPETSPSLFIRVVQIELATPRYERASDNVSDEREITWNKPENPFDLQQYLLEGGLNTWASGKQANLKIISKAARPGVMLNGAAQAGDSPSKGRARLTPTPARPGVGPPEEVQEVPTKKRKRYEVPDIPGVAIFRSQSKREVEPGEILSESDIDPDDSWLRVRHNVEDFPRLTGAAREFTIMFDEHLKNEPTNQGERHVSGMIVRFTRKHAERLGKPHLLKEFKTKLNELESLEMISEEYINYCLGLIASTRQDKINGTANGQTHGSPAIKEESEPFVSRNPPPASTKPGNRLDVIMIEDSDTEIGAEVSPAVLKSSRPIQPSTQHATDGDVEMQDAVHHAPNACVCGKLALGARQVIICQNNVSSPHLSTSFDSPLTFLLVLPTFRVSHGLCWTQEESPRLAM